MAKENAPEKLERAIPCDSVVFMPRGLEAEEDYIVCDLCGHRNTKADALCKMCSNYLEVKNG